SAHKFRVTALVVTAFMRSCRPDRINAVTTSGKVARRSDHLSARRAAGPLGGVGSSVLQVFLDASDDVRVPGADVVPFARVLAEVVQLERCVRFGANGFPV